MKKVIIASLFVLFALTGCTKNSNDMQEIIAVGGNTAHFVYAYTDKETGVTCLCTSDGGITPKLDSDGTVYKTKE